jgi:hypothetical protein
MTAGITGSAEVRMQRETLLSPLHGTLQRSCTRVIFVAFFILLKEHSGFQIVFKRHTMNLLR